MNQVSLIAVLGVTTERTLRRGLAGWNQEAAAAAIAKTNPTVTAGLLPSPYPPAYPTASSGKMAADHQALAGPDAGPEAGPEGTGHHRAEGVAEESTTAHDVGILVVALGSCILLAMLRGSNQRTSWLDCACGSPTYWLLTLAQFLLLVLVSMRVRTTLLHRHARRVAMNYQFLPDDVQWSEENSLRYPIICAVAGLCAGLFGIGGGIVKVAHARTCCACASCTCPCFRGRARLCGTCCCWCMGMCTQLSVHLSRCSAPMCTRPHCATLQGPLMHACVHAYAVRRHRAL